MVRLKRVYDEPTAEDGERILVERLWPRGLTKEKAAVDLWLKEIAPSPDLRKWYSHDVSKWERFRERYRRELEENPGPVTELRRRMRAGDVTLVYAARDDEHNSAVVLREFLRKRSASRKAAR